MNQCFWNVEFETDFISAMDAQRTDKSMLEEIKPTLPVERQIMKVELS